MITLHLEMLITITLDCVIDCGDDANDNDYDIPLAHDK